MDSGLAGLRPRPGMTKLYGRLDLPVRPRASRTQQRDKVDSRFRGNDRMRSAGSRIYFVIAGLDPAIHGEPPHSRVCRMDARVKPAHDE